MSQLDLAVQRGCRLLLAASARFDPLPAGFVLQDIPENSLTRRLATLNSGLAALNIRAVLFTKGNAKFLLPVRNEQVDAVHGGLRESAVHGPSARPPEPEKALQDPEANESATRPPDETSLTETPQRSAQPASQEQSEHPADSSRVSSVSRPGFSQPLPTSDLSSIFPNDYTSWIASLREEVADDYGLTAVAKRLGKNESKQDYMSPELVAYFGAYFVIRFFIHLGDCEIREQDLIEQLSESVLAPSYTLSHALSMEYANMDPAARATVWGEELKWYFFRGLLTLSEGETRSISAYGPVAQALCPEHDVVMTLARIRPPSEVSEEQYVADRMRKYEELVALKNS